MFETIKCLFPEATSNQIEIKWYQKTAGQNFDQLSFFTVYGFYIKYKENTIKPNVRIKLSLFKLKTI